MAAPDTLSRIYPLNPEAGAALGGGWETAPVLLSPQPGSRGGIPGQHPVSGGFGGPAACLRGGGQEAGRCTNGALLPPCPPSLRSSSSKLAQLTLEQILEHLDNLRLNLTNTKQNCRYRHPPSPQQLGRWGVPGDPHHPRGGRGGVSRPL